MTFAAAWGRGLLVVGVGWGSGMIIDLSKSVSFAKKWEPIHAENRKIIVKVSGQRQKSVT